MRMTERDGRALASAEASEPRWRPTDILDPDGHVDVAALDDLEMRMREARAWDELARMLTFAADRCPDPDRTRRAWATVGQLCREELGAARRAEPFFARALASDPNRIEVLEGLRAVAASTDRWEEAANLTERLAQAASGERAAQYWLEVADIAVDQLDQQERGLRALLQARLADPRRIEVLESAFRLLVRLERWEDAVRALRDHETLLDGASRSARAELAHRYLEIGVRLLSEALHHRSAQSCLEQARALGDERALSRLDELAAIRADWRTHAQGLVASGLETRDKSRAAELYLQAAQMHLVYGRDPVKADEQLNRALLLRGYKPALAYLEAVFVGQGKIEELIKRLNALMASLRDAPTKVEVSLRIARLLGLRPLTEPGVVDSLVQLFERVLALEPSHREASRAAVALLTQQERFAEAARLLETHLAAEDDEFLKVNLHLELGRMYAELLGDAPRARAHFEAVLALRPTHYRAATALRALYRDADEAPLLLNVLRVLLEYMPDVETRGRILDEMEGVARELAPEDGYLVARRRFDLFPANGAAAEDFEKRSYELHRESSLAQGLERAAERLPPERAAELYRKAGRIYDQRLPRPKDAIRCYRAGLEILTGDPEMQEALERLLRQQDDPEALAALLRTQLERAADDDKRILIAARLGQVLFRELGRLEESAELFESVLQVDPESAVALAQLDELYAAKRDSERQEAILARREQITLDPETLSEIQGRRARLLARTLGRPEEAVDLYAELLERQPDRTEHVSALERLLQSAIRESEIARILERWYAQHGKYDRQVEMLDVLIRTERTAPRRRELALRAAHICEARLSEPGPTFDYLAVALALDPADEAVKSRLLDAAGQIEALNRAGQVFATILEREDLAPEVVASLAQAQAEIEESVLQDPDRAVASYRRVLAADPGSSTAVAALERLLGEQGRYDELASVLEQQIDGTDNQDDLIRLLLSLADVREHRLQDPEGAAQAYRQAVKLAPTDPTIQGRLADLLERAGRHDELFRLLEAMLQAAGDREQQAALRARMGDVLRSAEGDPKAAVEQYRRALTQVPDHPRAVAGLEAMFDDPRIPGLAGRLLVPVFRQHEGRSEDLVQALSASVEAAESVEERRSTLVELARLHQELANPAAAFEAWARVFRASELEASELDEWTEVAVAAREARALAGLWAGRLDAATDPDLLRRLARLYDGPVAEPALAKRAWEGLLATAPQDAEALDALERLAASTDPQRLAEILKTRAEAATDADDQAAYLRRAAALFEESLDDPRGAAEALEHALERVPSDQQTLADLIRLYAELDEPARHRTALEKMIAIQETGPGRADALVALARFAESTEQTEEAVDAYGKALEAAPDHPGAREGLEALLDGAHGVQVADLLEPVYRSHGDWGRLVRLYEVRAQRAQDPAAALEQWVAIRSLYEERLDRPEQAFEAALHVIDRAPDEANHWVALERLGTATGAIEQVIARSDRRAAAAADPAAGALEHAVRLERLGVEGSRIAAAWDRVRQLGDGSPEALERLAGYYDRSGRTRELAETLQALGQHRSGADAAEAFRRAGALWEDRLSMPQEAIRCFEQVLEQHPDPDTLARLDALYAKTRRSEQRAAVLERRAKSSVGTERAERLVALAELRRSELHDPGGSLAAYESALEAGPPDRGVVLDAIESLMVESAESHPHVAGRAAGLVLEPLQRNGESARAIRAIRLKVATTDEPQTRVELWRRLAGLARDELADPSTAYEGLAAAFRDAPQDDGLREELEVAAAESERDSDLAELLARTVRSSDEPDLKLRLARRAAEIFEERLDRPDAALAMVRVIRTLDPQDREALTALERLAKKGGDAHRLVELYRELIAESEQPAELWLRVAALAEGELQDDDLAYDAYRGWRAVGGVEPAIRRRFAALCERSQRWDELVELLEEDAAEAETSDGQRQILLRLAVLHRDRRRDPAAAFSALVRASDAAPHDASARAGLMDLMQSAPPAVAARAASALLERLDEDAIEERIRAHTVLGETAPDEGTQTAHWVRASALAGEGAGDASRAFELALRAVALRAEDASVREQGETWAERSGRWKDLETVYQAVVSQGLSPESAIAIHRRLAERFETAGDGARAVAEYQMALELAPDDESLLQALERLFEGQGDFTQLSEVFRRRIAATDDPEQQASLMRQFAELQATRLHDLGAAIATLRRLLEIDPGDQTALIKLDRWLEQQERSEERVEVLERLVGQSGDLQVRLDARLRWARLETVARGNPSAGIELARDNLQEAPSHGPTREWLEARLRTASEEKNRAQLEPISQVLQTAYRATEDWSELIGTLRAQVDGTPEAAGRADLMVQIADVYGRHLDQGDLAFATLLEAIRLAPGRADVRVRAEILAEGQGIEEELGDAYLEIAPETADPDAAVALLRQAGRVFDRRGIEPERAFATWQEVLRRVPDDAEALDVLDERLRDRGDGPQLAKVLERKARLAQDEGARFALLADLGRVFAEQVGDRRQAVQAFRQARELRPQDRNVALGLARLLDPQAEAEELYEVFESLEKGAAKPTDKVPVLLRMGHLAENVLDRPDAALEHYRRTLEHEPLNEHGFQGVVRLYRAAGRWGELAEVLESRLEQASDEEEQVALHRQLGALRAQQLADPTEAIDAWKQVLRRTPNDLEALAAMRELLRTQEAWEELTEVLRRLLTLSNEPHAIKEVRFELAEVLLEHLNAPNDAVEVARRIIDIQPHSPTELLRLEEILIAAGAYGEAVKAKMRRVEQSSSPAEQIEVLEEIAELYDEKIRRSAGAIQTYERILQLDPAHDGAFEGLTRLYEAIGDHRKLVDLLSRRLSSAETEADRAKYHLRVAELQERALGSKDLAFAAACAAFTDGGAALEAQQLMQRLAEETDNQDMLVDVMEDQVDRVPLERAMTLRLEVARLAAEVTDEPERAERHLEMLLAMQPGHPQASELLEGILRRDGRWEDLMLHLRDQSELVESAEERRGLLGKLAQVEEQALGRVEAAAQTWLRISERFPGDEEADRELERIYRLTQRPDALIDLLERRLEDAEGEARVRALLEMGAAREELGQFDHAIEAHQQALEIDPANRSALEAQERLFNRVERWPDLVAVYEKRLANPADAAEALDFLTRMASLYEAQFSDIEAAAETLERVFEYEPNHEPTLRTLVRYHRSLEQPGRRAELLERLRHRAPDDRPALTEELAELYTSGLSRYEDAEGLYRELLEAEPNSTSALSGLAMLAERHGDWSRALDYRKREAELVPQDQAVEAHHRIGTIARDQLRDRTLAALSFERALELDPHYVPALAALRGMAEEDRDPGRALDLLEREAAAEPEAAKRAQLFHDAATQALDGFDDVDRAIRSLRFALEAEPTHQPALIDLSELLFSDEQYEEAGSILERVIAVLEGGEDRAELGRQHYRLAYVAERSGDDPRALTHYLASYEADNTYLPTLEGLAAALKAAERHEDALRVYQAILVNHRASLTDAEIVDVHHQVGEMARKSGQPDRAKKSLVKALDLDPKHTPTLRELADLSETVEEYEDAYDFRERMIEQLADPDERFEALIRQGNLCRDQIDEPYRAIDAYQAALALHPDDIEVKRTLVPLLESTRQFGLAVKILGELAEAADSTEEQRDLWIRAGDLKWSKERDWGAAAESYNRALDADPGHAVALQKLESMLAEAKQWRALEENYVRMIRRLPKENKKARVALWKTLGELYTRVLKDPKGAARAYEVVFSLEPGDPQVGLQLAQLYRRQADRRREAVSICQQVLPLVPDPGPPARLFAEIAYEQAQYDAAFAGLGALMLLRVAQEEEVRAYRALLEKAPPWPTGGVSDSQWRRVLLHPACRGPLGALVGAVYRHAPDLFSARRRTAALKKKERVDLTDKRPNAPVRLRYFDVWARVAQVLGLPDVEHYRRPGSVEPPRLLPGAPRPVLFAGEQHEVFKTMPVRQIAWLVGRQMAIARPELAPAQGLSAGDFLALAEATVQIYQPEGSGMATQIDPSVVQAWNRALRAQLDDAALAELSPIVADCLRQGSLQNVIPYLEGAEHSASRAALLVAGDWITASRGLGEADALVDMPREGRVRELVLFSLSSEFLALREALSARVQL